MNKLDKRRKRIDWQLRKQRQMQRLRNLLKKKRRKEGLRKLKLRRNEKLRSKSRSDLKLSR